MHDSEIRYCYRYGFSTNDTLLFKSPVSNYVLIIAELAIIATDIAEIIGSAIALDLLFNIPLIIGALITVLDVFFYSLL